MNYLFTARSLVVTLLIVGGVYWFVTSATSTGTYEHIQTIEKPNFTGEKPDYRLRDLYRINKSDNSLYLTLKENVSGTVWYRKPVTFWTNTYGLRDDPVPTPRENEKRILVIGNSHTFGFAVNQSDRYTDLLERKLKEEYETQITVMNAAIGGWGYNDYYDLLRNYGEQLQPDIIIIAHVSNDIYPRNLHDELVNEVQSKLDRKEYETLETYRNAVNRYISEHKKEQRDEYFQKSVKTLERISDNAQDLEADLVFYSLSQPIPPIVEQKIEELSKKPFQFKMTGPHQFMTQEKETTIDGYHPSPQGHKQIAEDLYDKLDALLQNKTVENHSSQEQVVLERYVSDKGR